MARDQEITGWHPASWRQHDAAQLPVYADAASLADVEAQLRSADPIVAIEEAAKLKALLARVHKGGTILQGGDCAERFDDDVEGRVTRLSDLFDTLTERWRGREFHVRIARIGGQFAKPRSVPEETRGNKSLTAYRGDLINGQDFTPEDRAPDPTRMLRAHAQSLATVKALAAQRSGRDPIFTCHEGLLLPYEEALSRRDDKGRWWATSAHFLWLGYRTQQIDGAHVAYLSGIANPIGIKCGPGLTPDALKALCDALDPHNERGRLTLISRFGADRIAEELPPLLQATAGRAVNWIIDPMHGNTERIGELKTRRMNAILREISEFRLAGGRSAGLHIEMSAEPVTECLGLGGPTDPADLSENYRTACDPRLNLEQALIVMDHFKKIAT